MSNIAVISRVVFLVAVLIHMMNSASISKRSDYPPTIETCQGRTPCGWAIYNKTNRIIDYFMKNRCVCDENRTCVRDSDDISIASYVYRCLLKEYPSSEN